MTPPFDVDSLRAELLQLTQSAKAHLEAQYGSGAWGLPADTNAASLPVAGPSASTDEPALPTLAQLQETARDCGLCALHKERNQSVFSRGDGSSGVVFVGEGPGAEEDRQGIPFVGPAGQLLDKMILAMGLNLESVYVCNIVKCRPPNNRKPESAEIAACSPLLTQQLALLRPKVIVALGATAVKGLLGMSGGITRLRGQWYQYQDTIPVMPTFHPAYLLRQPAAKREVWQDLKQVLARLEKTR